MSLAATQQVCAAGALLAILQRDHVLNMATPAARGSDDMDVDDRHTKALVMESLAEVFPGTVSLHVLIHQHTG